MKTLELAPVKDLNFQSNRDPLAAFYQAAVQEHLPTAIWRQPHGLAPEALVDLSGAAQPVKIDFTRQTPGFVFSPFVNHGGRASLFLNAHLHLDSAGLHPAPAVESNGLPKHAKERFMAAYHRILYSPSLASPWFVLPAHKRGAAAATQAQFCRLVADAIAYIQQTGIKKIVVSRAVETPLPAHFNPIATFNLLCQKYPHAFVSLVSIPGLGTWLGASPELLLSLSGAQFSTVALAGTQARPPHAPLESVRWGAKEIEEQALVGDYIRDFFRQQGLDHFIEAGPHTVSAGNVVHLQTRFEVNLAPARLLRLANEVLYTLHPTSAVCGMPKKEALSFILAHENYHRAFYSGFLGPVHLRGQSNLFVNLRCMQLGRERAVLYVGAGITPDSVPAAEWEETVMKSNTLLAVLQPNVRP